MLRRYEYISPASKNAVIEGLIQDKPATPFKTPRPVKLVNLPARFPRRVAYLQANYFLPALLFASFTAQPISTVTRSSSTAFPSFIQRTYIRRERGVGSDTWQSGEVLDSISGTPDIRIHMTIRAHLTQFFQTTHLHKLYYLSSGPTNPLTPPIKLVPGALFSGLGGRNVDLTTSQG